MIRFFIPHHCRWSIFFQNTAEPFACQYPLRPKFELSRLSCFALIVLTVVYIRTYVYLRFNGHFPGGSGLPSTIMSPFWILLKLRIVVSGDNWTCKAPVKSSLPTSQHPAVYRPDPSLSPNEQCQNTEGNAYTYIPLKSLPASTTWRSGESNNGASRGVSATVELLVRL